MCGIFLLILFFFGNEITYLSICLYVYGLDLRWNHCALDLDLFSSFPYQIFCFHAQAIFFFFQIRPKQTENHINFFLCLILHLSKK